MSVVRNDSDVADSPPKASRKFDRDSARRMRAVPRDRCDFTEDHVIVPLEYMLTLDDVWRKGGKTVSELIQSLLARVDHLEHLVYNGWSESEAAKANRIPDAVRNSKVQPMKPAANDAKVADVVDIRPDKYHGGIDEAVESAPGVSVPGNEAETLVVDDDSPTEEGSKPEAVTAGASDNDKVVQLGKNEPDDLDKRLATAFAQRLADESESQAVQMPDSDGYWVDEITRSFSFSPEEAVEILTDEYRRRNAMTQRKHQGKTYEQVRAERAERKEGMYIPGESYFFKSKDSRYLLWKRMHCNPVASPDPWERLAEIRMNLPDACATRLKREKRRKLDDLRSRSSSAKVLREVAFMQHTAAAPEPPPIPRTIRSRLSAFRLRWQDRMDVVRRFFRQPIPDRHAVLRAEYAKDRDPNDCPFAKWDTVRVATSGRPSWFRSQPKDLDGMGSLARTRAIGQALVQRGTFTPIEMTIMQRQLGTFFTEVDERRVAMTDD